MNEIYFGRICLWHVEKGVSPLLVGRVGSKMRLMQRIYRLYLKRW